MSYKKTNIIVLLFSAAVFISCDKRSQKVILPIDNENTNNPTTINTSEKSVQELLNSGESPFQIYLSNSELLTEIIGSNFQGGKIFYLDTDTGEGLISIDFDITDKAYGPCTPYKTADLGDSAINGGAYVLADLKLYNDFYANDCAVPGNAAKLCDDFIHNGYDDWFLPDLQTMIHMTNSQVLSAINGKYWCANIASFEGRNQVYDSSSNFKYLPSFDFTNQNTFAIRPARYFNATATNEPSDAIATSVSEKLASNKTPWQLLDEGLSKQELYGEYYDGGLITYLNEIQRTGIVVGLHHLRWEEPGIPLYEWGCFDIGINDPNGNGTSGNGLYNSTIISSSSCTVRSNSNAQQEIAATAALNYSTNQISNQAYDDWYLPNLTELTYYNNLFQSKYKDLFASAHYWSSSTSDALFNANAILYPRNEMEQLRRDRSALMIPARNISE